MKVARITKQNQPVKQVFNRCSKQVKKMVREMIQDELEYDVMNENEYNTYYAIQTHILSDGYINGLNVGNIVG